MEANDSAPLVKQKTMDFPLRLVRDGPGKSSHAEPEEIALPRPGDTFNLTRSRLAPSSIVYSRSKPVASVNVNHRTALPLMLLYIGYDIRVNLASVFNMSKVLYLHSLIRRTLRAAPRCKCYRSETAPSYASTTRFIPPRISPVD